MRARGPLNPSMPYCMNHLNEPIKVVISTASGEEVREVDPSAVSMMTPPEQASQSGYGIAVVNGVEIKIVKQGYTMLYAAWRSQLKNKSK